jgi:hypothetical protein
METRTSKLFKNPFDSTSSPLDSSLGFKNDYDSTAFAFLIKKYLLKHGAKSSKENVLSIMKAMVETLAERKK